MEDPNKPVDWKNRCELLGTVLLRMMEIVEQRPDLVTNKDETLIDTARELIAEYFPREVVR